MDWKNLFGVRIANLFSIKSIVTILMTVYLGIMLFTNHQLPDQLVALYSSVYGAVMTFYFTKKEKNDGDSK